MGNGTIIMLAIATISWVVGAIKEREKKRAAQQMQATKRPAHAEPTPARSTDPATRVQQPGTATPKAPASVPAAGLRSALLERLRSGEAVESTQARPRPTRQTPTPRFASQRPAAKPKGAFTQPSATSTPRPAASRPARPAPQRPAPQRSVPPRPVRPAAPVFQQQQQPPRRVLDKPPAPQTKPVSVATIKRAQGHDSPTGALPHRTIGRNGATALRSRSGLRNAIVLSELLAPPVSLRQTAPH